jgi:hypothetical protein
MNWHKPDDPRDVAIAILAVLAVLLSTTLLLCR